MLQETNELSLGLGWCGSGLVTWFEVRINMIYRQLGNSQLDQSQFSLARI